MPTESQIRASQPDALKSRIGIGSDTKRVMFLERNAAGSEVVVLNSDSLAPLTVPDAASRKSATYYTDTLEVIPYKGMLVNQTNLNIAGRPRVLWKLIAADVSLDASWMGIALGDADGDFNPYAFEIVELEDDLNTAEANFGQYIRVDGNNVTLGAPAAFSRSGEFVLAGPGGLLMASGATYGGDLFFASDPNPSTPKALPYYSELRCRWDNDEGKWYLSLVVDIEVGVSGPVGAPFAEGIWYVDVAEPAIYYAVGSSGSGDWIQVANKALVDTKANLSGGNTFSGAQIMSGLLTLTGQTLSGPNNAVTRAWASAVDIVKGSRLRPLRYFDKRENAGAVVSSYGEDAFINMTSATSGAYAEAYFGEFQLPSQPFSGARLAFSAPFLFGFSFALVSASATSRLRVGVANARSTAPAMADAAPFSDNNINVSVRMNGGVLQIGLEYYAGSYKQSWATLHASHNSNRTYHAVLHNLGNGTYKLWAASGIDYTSPPATLDITATPLITIADGPTGYPPGNSSRASAIVVNNAAASSSTNDRWMVGSFRQEYL